MTMYQGQLMNNYNYVARAQVIVNARRHYAEDLEDKALDIKSAAAYLANDARYYRAEDRLETEQHLTELRQAIDAFERLFRQEQPQ
jgi:peptidoglycan/xylan/chitin deacetylase (PgdA/CDA1 family)